MKIIYRKTGGLVVGTCTPPLPIEMEMTNILLSELGGQPEGYATVDAPAKSDDEIYTVQAGAVVLVPVPAVQARNPRLEQISTLPEIAPSQWTSSQWRQLLQLTAEELSR